MSRIDRFRHFFTHVRAYAPLLLELSVTLASARVAVLLLHDQTYFDRVEAPYRFLVAHMGSSEWKWGAFAMLAAVLKVSGLVLLWARKNDLDTEVAFVLREIGWGMSVCFWSCFCISTTVWDAWSLLSIASAAMAMLSIGSMIMGPAMPEEDHGPGV